MPLHTHEIDFFYFIAFELILKCSREMPCPCADNQSSRIRIQTVNKSRPVRATFNGLVMRV